MSLFKWITGRQSTQEFYYQRLKIYSFWRTDCYLIRWGKGTAVGNHLDKVKGYKHYRLNIRLMGDKKKLFVIGKPIFHFWRICFFRPDKYLHGLKPTDKKGLLISFGFILREVGE